MNNLSTEPRLPIGIKPGAKLGKLFLPAIEITRVISYQHRTKERYDAGYYHAHVTNNGRIYVHRKYRVNIKGFQAWRIKFKSRHQSTVNIIMQFSIYDKHGLVSSFTETYNNLRPGEPGEILVIQGKRRTNIMLESIQVYSGSMLLYNTSVKAFLPKRKWSFILSFLIALSMGFYAMSLYSNNSDIYTDKGAAGFVLLLSLFIASGEIMKITPVVLMIFLLLMVTFSFYDNGQIGVFLVLGCMYLWSVWIKRSSIKDFLIGGFLPNGS